MAPLPSPALRRPARDPGFTLVEVLVAVSLGALLLVAMATTAGSFAQAVSYLRNDTADAYDEALARIVQDVRYAWSVSVPSSGLLRVVHADGTSTEYSKRGNDLMVKSPGGASGTLISGIARLSFSGQTVQRYREAAPGKRTEIHHEVPAPANTATALQVKDGTSLALNFVRHSPAGITSAAGVAEQVLDYLPTSFQIAIAAEGSKGDLLYEIFPARAPGDARPMPGAVAAASGSVPISSLPKVTTKGGKDRKDKKKDKGDKKDSKKGDGDKKGGDMLALSLLVPGPGILATLGPTVLAFLPPLPMGTTYTPPTSRVSFGLGAWAGTPLSGPLTSGSAYTLVLTVRGKKSSIFVASHIDNTGASKGLVYTGKSKKKGSATSWTVHTDIVPWGLSGDARLTSTTATNTVSLVKIDVTTTAGINRLRSVPVYNQVLVSGPWLGMVPGETAPASP